MSEPRVWADSPAEIVTGETWHHLSSVLRLKSGDRYRFVCGDGSEYLARLMSASRGEGRIEIVDRVLLPTPKIVLSLYVGLLKGDQLDGVFQRATEVGVTRLVPMLTERSVSRGERMERWRRIVRSAAAQSRRGDCPEVAALQGFWEAVAGIEGAGVLFWERHDGTGLQLPLVHKISVLVGPEGGFTEAEVAAATAAGLLVRGLGPRVMRAETAAVVASALVMGMLGEPGFS